MPSTSSQRVCLVTGGAGFIGSHLVEHLAARGDRVVVVDDLSTGRRSNLAAGDADRVTLIEGAVSDVLPRLNPSEFDEIYHLAAAVGVRLVIRQPIGTIETNVLQTSAALEFAAAGSTPILVASTSEVYGKSAQLPFAEDDDVVYGPPTQPRWAYACSKAIDEFLALAYHKERDLRVVVVRFFNIVGPRQVGQYGMVLPRLVAAALEGKPLEVHGDGRQTRSFCDVRDIVGVVAALLADAGCAGGVYNVGSDEPVEIGALAQLVCDTLGSRSQVVRIPYEEAFGPGFDDLRHRQPDLTRLRRVTDFTPRFPLAQTIRDLADELSRQPSSSLEPTA
ncbi:MAG: NAD-dependent epimerase/dehydratase family protein [Planctomycetota bacterium]|jgi:UDP-glucose 4-epimerase